MSTAAQTHQELPPTPRLSPSMEEERALQQLERDTNAFLLEAVGSELAVNAPSPFPERDQLHMKNDLSTGSSAVDEPAYTAQQLADQMKPLAQTQSEAEGSNNRFIEGLTSCESVGDSGRVIDPYVPAMNESDDMEREEPISENKIQKMEDSMLHAQKETHSEEEDRRAMEEDLKERQKLLEQFGVSPKDEQTAEQTANEQQSVSERDRDVKGPSEQPQGEQGGLPVDKMSDGIMQTEEKGKKRATNPKGRKRVREEPVTSTEPLRRSGRIRQKHTPGPEFITDAAIEDDIKRMRRMIH
eukprot:GILK01007275.1.p1 GENE.GILK01007275.1~~GILK01007275.1.p1  ORF type:complete len:299 (-),score=56.14 GILK01007275.1:402-1298(-)